MENQKYSATSFTMHNSEEIIGILTAISVVSKRLARKMAELSSAENEEEGESHDG